MHFFPPELPFFYLAEDCSLEADNLYPLQYRTGLGRLGVLVLTGLFWLQERL